MKRREGRGWEVEMGYVASTLSGEGIHTAQGTSLRLTTTSIPCGVCTDGTGIDAS